MAAHKVGPYIVSLFQSELSVKCEVQCAVM